jgi:xanthine dehydrogenase YagS FAD-binding subunit
VLAGGTDLLSLMKDGVASPKRVVSVKDVPELKGIRKTAGGLRIGAAVTFDEVMSSPLVRAEYPSILEAVRGVTSPQIRNMGTVGGDLCQRPRCWYYRAGFGLIPMHEGKDMVAEGENKYHAIFSTGPAKFVSASSLGPALAALGAKVKLVSASGEREVEVANFFVSPGDAGAREIDLKPTEVLAEVVVPAAVGVKNATYEVRMKDALDWPLATASVALKMKGASVASARVVLGHVAPTPWNAAAAAEFLQGKTITAEVAEQAGAKAVEGAKPLSGNAYKVQLAKVAVKRAILAAAGLKWS